MFSFDLIILGLSTAFWYGFFNLPNLYGLPIVLIIITGLVVLFLKANYKIREFNNTLKNTYLLFEGIVFGGYDRVRMMEYLWENGCIEVKSEKNIETGYEIEWNIHL